MRCAGRHAPTRRFSQHDRGDVMMTVPGAMGGGSMVIGNEAGNPLRIFARKPPVKLLLNWKLQTKLPKS
jgi:hypothetical protein